MKKHSAPPPQVQLPPVHASDVDELHARPHEPQCEVLVCVLTQSPLQHCSLPPVHVRPQSPQFMIVSSRTQVPPQQPVPPVHAGPVPQRQVPAMHVSPAPQAGVQVRATHEPPAHI